jgi:hypothetical protein
MMLVPVGGDGNELALCTTEEPAIAVALGDTWAGSSNICGVAR